MAAVGVAGGVVWMTSGDEASPPTTDITTSTTTTSTDTAPTAGLLRPARATNSSGTSASQLSLVEEADGTLFVAYLGTDGRLRWQRNGPDGAFTASPVLEAGVVDRPLGEDRRVVATDVIGDGDGFVIAQHVDGRGVVVQQVDHDLQPEAPALVLDTLAWPSLGRHGDDLFLAAQEGDAIVLVGLVTGDTGPAATTWRQVTTPTAAADRYPDLAVADDRLVVAYERRPRTGSATLRAAVITPASGAVERDLEVTSSWYPSGKSATAPGATVTGSGDTATVFWRRSVSGSVRLFLARIDPGSGAVTRVLDAAPRTDATADLFGHSGGYALVQLGAATHLLALDPVHAISPAVDGISRAARFTLRPVLEGGLPGGPTVLEGGTPVRPDVLVDADGFAQNPRLAVVGAPVVIEAAVVNRGQQTAQGVTVEVWIAGVLHTSIPAGSLQAEERQRIAVDWTPPPSTTATTVPVEIRVSTTTAQYTTGNDTAAFDLEVRQTAIVSGRLADVSYDLARTSDWIPGIGGAEVTVGDLPAVLTDDGGFFRVEDLPFGTYTVTAEKEGFTPATVDVTVTRDRPFAFARLLTDNHGTLVLQVRDELGRTVSGASAQLLGGGPTTTVEADGTVRYSLPAGPYELVVSAPGHWPAGPTTVDVVFDTETTRSVVVEQADEGIVSGRVVGPRGRPLADAVVTIDPVDPEVDPITVGVDDDGRFGDVRLPAAPSAAYRITATSPSETGEGVWEVMLRGGEVRSEVLVVAPSAADLGELRLSSTVEGYTSWMVKASWPGFLGLPSAAMYTWFGNYAIRVGAEYWDGTHELVGVDVSVQGHAYESHATQSEIDLTEMHADYGEVFEITEFSDEHLDAGVNLFEVLTGETDQILSGVVDTVLGVGGDVVDLVTGDAADDWVVTGQGPELLTWGEAREDFAVSFDLDTSSPGGVARSLFADAVAVPRGFAIPLVIGGSSEQQTSVRVDQVDVVDVATREVLWSSGEDPWFSFGGSEPTTNGATRRYDVDVPGIDERDVAIYVWLRVGKVDAGDLASPGGPSVGSTAFEQRAQQVVILRPGNQAMLARIAPGDPYLHPEDLHLPAS